MRVLVTGAGGFVGRWLARELDGAGHSVIATTRDELDVTDQAAFERALEASGPDAIAHLAAVSFAPDARDDPANAFAMNVGGTLAMLEAVRRSAPRAALLVTGSSEVYGAPQPHELPLTEDSPLRPRTPYALSKAAQEGVALAHAARHSARVVVTRSFNHIGPGQRDTFVVPALAGRVQAVRAGKARSIPVGNLDVRRDFTDVRDVATAYRLLLERLAEGRIQPGGAIFNVASGHAVPIRMILSHLCALARVDAPVVPDTALVRSDDPPEICGSAERIRAATGWRPERQLEQTLRDVWESIAERSSEE